MDAVVAALVGGAIGAIGGFVVAWSSSKWEDQRTLRALTVERYRDGRDLLDDLVGFAGRRHFALQRWLWSLQDPDGYDTDEVRREYFSLLPTWNERTWGYRAKLRLLLGDPVAIRFLDYADDDRDQAESLHYMFVQAHDAVRGVEDDRGTATQAQSEVTRLNHAWSQFADDVTAQLLKQAVGLRLVKIPDYS